MRDLRAFVVLLIAGSGCGSVNTAGDAGPGDGGHDEFALAVTAVGPGTVMSDPAGIACGSTCDGVYPAGTMVTLTATPDPGDVFGGWSGDCTGDGDCVVTIDAARNVTATFGCTGTQTFDFTGDIQTFDVPDCALALTIDAYGAQGGATAGALGARIKGTFTSVTASQLVVLVGGQGGNAYDTIGAGGGGTFVYVDGDAMPLVVAGGGGGIGGSSSCIPGAGSATETPKASVSGTGNGPSGSGGSGGSGGASGDVGEPSAGGGAGWLSNGGIGVPDGSSNPGGGGGVAPRNGGAGGTAGTGGGFAGGFGGGGGSASGNGGGGGGYNGGGGGNAAVGGGNWGCGAGGGSYNGGDAPINSESVRMGNGQVIITW
jgi:Divergent InlB B-repeat domain